MQSDKTNPFGVDDKERRFIPPQFKLSAHAEKPKWYEFRKRVARRLVRIAARVYPQSPEVNAFYTKMMVDTMITGGAFCHVKPNKVKINPESGEVEVNREPD